MADAAPVVAKSPEDELNEKKDALNDATSKLAALKAEIDSLSALRDLVKGRPWLAEGLGDLEELTDERVAESGADFGSVAQTALSVVPNDQGTEG